MNFWPFRRKSKEPMWKVSVVHDDSGDFTIAAIWSLYGATKIMVRQGDYAREHPEARGRTSAYDEEFFARDAIARNWAARALEEQRTNAYLQLLVRVRQAGLMGEYVWRFFGQRGWREPAGLNLPAFDVWVAANGMKDHRPVTLAWVERA
jgi:hypothetical protein